MMSRETAFKAFIEEEINRLQEQCRAAAGQQAAAQHQGDYAACRQAAARLEDAQNRLAYWADYKARNPGLYAAGGAMPGNSAVSDSAVSA